MNKISHFRVLFLILVIAACKTSKIKSDRFYRDPMFGWPTVILYKNSVFSFNYIVPNKFSFTGPSLFPEKYFITQGHWKLKQGNLILTSSSDSPAQSIESSHPMINPLVKSPADPGFSIFVFSDIWGDTIQINRVRMDNKTFSTNIDTTCKFYKRDMSANDDVLTFYFKNYEPYTFRNSGKINMDYDITLQPEYSGNFFQNDTFRMTKKKLIDIKRKLELERVR